MIKYGLISEVDWACIKKTIDLILPEFWDEKICVTEIGLYNCHSSIAIKEYVESREMAVAYTGIDNQKDKEIIAPDWMNLIIGNSNEVYNQLEDNSQHLIFEDSCHCYGCVIGNWYHYSPKVKIGGYYAFHDTGKHIAAFKDYQHGDKEKQDSYISVRKALTDLGLYEGMEGWELVFDEADILDAAGGITVLKRLF